MINRSLLFAGLLALLAACGGGGAGGGGIDPRLARLDLYEAQRARVLGDPDGGIQGMPLTPDTAVPASGQAMFAGATAILIDDPSGVLALAGDAALTITFADQVATGSVTNVFGQTAGGGIVDYTGGLTLVGQATGAEFELGYAGTLTGGHNVYGFDGILEATLLGDPISGFAALDLDALIDQAGVSRQGSIVIFGEGLVTAPPALP